MSASLSSLHDLFWVHSFSSKKQPNFKHTKEAFYASIAPTPNTVTCAQILRHSQRATKTKTNLTLKVEA